MGRRIEVTINPNACTLHTAHLHCGLIELDALGMVRLTLDRGIPAGTRSTMWADVEGVMCHFDMRDGPNLSEGTEGATYYFKRTYRHDSPSNVFPYGLIFACRPPVFSDRLSWRHPRRTLSFRSRTAFEIDPLTPAEPKVLFLTRLWETTSAHGRDEETMSRINEMRAGTVRALKREFGQLFIGGLVNNQTARSQYPGLVAESTTKTAYLRALKRCAIAVTTTGLHQSTGFKLAEYLAASRCIVTEPLLNALPEPLQNGRHIIEFESPDECVEACASIMDDVAFVGDMREANFEYYIRNARPASAVSRCLRIITGGRQEPAVHGGVPGHIPAAV